MDGTQVDRAFKYFNMADPEGSGKIGFNDWRDLFIKASKKRHINPLVRGMTGMMAPESALHMEFDKADVNKDGFLEFHEFLAVSTLLIYSFHSFNLHLQLFRHGEISRSPLSTVHGIRSRTTHEGWKWWHKIILTWKPKDSIWPFRFIREGIFRKFFEVWPVKVSTIKSL